MLTCRRLLLPFSRSCPEHYKWPLSSKSEFRRGHCPTPWTATLGRKFCRELLGTSRPTWSCKQPREPGKPLLSCRARLRARTHRQSCGGSWRLAAFGSRSCPNRKGVRCVEQPWTYTWTTHSCAHVAGIAPFGIMPLGTRSSSIAARAGWRRSAKRQACFHQDLRGKARPRLRPRKLVGRRTCGFHGAPQEGGWQ